MKLDCIMLIDDDLATNFINENTIKMSGIDTYIQTCDSGGAALEYLTGNNQEPQPGIILLDLNMPGMNGWDFLDHYEKIPLEKRSNTILAILTTSVNPDDKIKAQKRSTVKQFFSKPLKKEHIETLISTHFEN